VCADEGYGPGWRLATWEDLSRHPRDGVLEMLYGSCMGQTADVAFVKYQGSCCFGPEFFRAVYLNEEMPFFAFDELHFESGAVLSLSSGEQGGQAGVYPFLCYSEFGGARRAACPSPPPPSPPPPPPPRPPPNPPPPPPNPPPPPSPPAPPPPPKMIDPSKGEEGVVKKLEEEGFNFWLVIGLAVPLLLAVVCGLLIIRRRNQGRNEDRSRMISLNQMHRPDEESGMGLLGLHAGPSDGLFMGDSRKSITSQVLVNPLAFGSGRESETRASTFFNPLAQQAAQDEFADMFQEQHEVEVSLLDELAGEIEEVELLTTEDKSAMVEEAIEFVQTVNLQLEEVQELLGAEVEGDMAGEIEMLRGNIEAMQSQLAHEASAENVNKIASDTANLIATLQVRLEEARQVRFKRNQRTAEVILAQVNIAVSDYSNVLSMRAGGVNMVYVLEQISEVSRKTKQTLEHNKDFTFDELQPALGECIGQLADVVGLLTSTSLEGDIGLEDVQSFLEEPSISLQALQAQLNALDIQYRATEEDGLDAVRRVRAKLRRVGRKPTADERPKEGPSEFMRALNARKAAGKFKAGMGKKEGG